MLKFKLNKETSACIDCKVESTLFVLILAPSVPLKRFKISRKTDAAVSKVTQNPFSQSGTTEQHRALLSSHARH